MCLLRCTCFIIYCKKMHFLSLAVSFFIHASNDCLFKKFLYCLLSGDTPSVLTEVMTDLGRLSEDVHKFAFEIVFAQLKNYLSNVSTMEVRML